MHPAGQFPPVAGPGDVGGVAVGGAVGVVQVCCVQLYAVAPAGQPGEVPAGLQVTPPGPVTSEQKTPRFMVLQVSARWRSSCCFWAIFTVRGIARTTIRTIKTPTVRELLGLVIKSKMRRILINE
ncbi:MAG TPA: hypothetical protein VKC89_01100 [Patescibacteria group bacterium]|nr:hypothetical protein [Patescibacteria group bacterium]